MKQLIKALVIPKIKTIYVLVLTGVIVMMSIHTNGSLNGSDLEIIKRLDDAGLSHAQVYPIDHTVYESDYESILPLLDSYKGKGVSYRVVEYGFSSRHYFYGYNLNEVTISSYNSFTEAGVKFTSATENHFLEYVNESGKNLDELEKDEIILPIEYKNLGYELGDTLEITNNIIFITRYLKGMDPNLTSFYCDFNDDPECFGHDERERVDSYKVKVVGFAKQKSHDEFLASSDFNPNIDFFKPDKADNAKVGLISQDTFDAIKDFRIIDLDEFRDYGKLMIQERPYAVSYLYDQLNAIDFGPKYNHEGTSRAVYPRSVYLKYSSFSKELEDELLKDIDRLDLGRNFIEEKRKYRLDTLTSKMDKEPMVTSVLQVLSKYVLVGVLVSSFYSFYIHFKNQIRTSSKEITALLMQGVPWSKILKVYLVELLFIALCSIGIYTVVSFVAGVLFSSDTLYSGIVQIHLQTLMYTALYFALLIVVLIFSLYTFRKDVLQKFKTGSQTQIHGFKLTKEGLVRQLSIKRVVKYLASTIGFAFSISLVISILVLAVSSSFHLKNLYSKETFGIQFDYMIRFNEHADASTVFEATKQYSEVQAQIDKNESILFTDHSLWEGNTAYYKSSEIVFYNEIKEFVPLYSGTYPPHWSEIKGDPPSYDQSALASRRHLDRRTRTGKKNSVESDYLFYYPDISSTYEQAYNIYGKVNALYNNGWALSAYRPFYDGPFEDTIIHTQQYVLNLKEDVNVKEFEAMLDSFKVEYTQYQELIDSFQENNNSMNATALLISMTVAILMSILLAINISGLIVSARMEVSEDDVLFKKLGISSMLLKKVTSSVLILRVLASVGFLFILISIIYPFFFQDLLSAFGLFSMPGSILVPFVILCIVVVLILMYIFSKMSKDIKSQ